MTRRDAALLTLTLAGIYCLVQATLLAAPMFIEPPPRSVMAPSGFERFGGVLPMLVLVCAGVSLIHSRRAIATWIFRQNPSHDSVAMINASETRTLVVSVGAVALLMQALRYAAQANVSGAAILGALAVACFMEPQIVTSQLYAAGAGSGDSPDFAQRRAFWLSIIGVYFAVATLPDVFATSDWRRIGGALAVVIAGLALFLRNRGIKSAA
jgi:hypothetical protein